MSLNMKSFTQALAKTAAVIEKTVQTTVQEVTGPKPLQEYDLLTQIGSAGPALVWKLYSAKARDSTRPHQYPTVCVWVLDKRALSEARTRAGLSKAAEDSFFDIIRADAGRLVRLRHPGVLHVVQALDENKNAMAMVTEPLFASVANALGILDNVSDVPKDLRGLYPDIEIALQEMGLLEVKHGLLQMAESLDFLHNNARLIHRAIAPENVLITSNGAWKLGGFGFAIPADQASGDSANLHAFHYAEYDVEDSVIPLQPSLDYTAPELVRSKSPSTGYSSDVFSFGCLTYHLITHKPLFDCHNNVKMIANTYGLWVSLNGKNIKAVDNREFYLSIIWHANTLTYLSSESFSSIPPELVSDLQKMLSSNESFRPTAMDFTGSSFFRNDTRLRALRFLDHMLERDNMQKTEFLKALSDMWKDFDSRVLRYKVLPPLCAELRNMVMQPMILPMVLTIAESQEKNDFELVTMPALVSVLSSAAGETLLLLLKNAELIINKTGQDLLVSHVLPMLIRAYGDTDPRIQEEVLKKSVPLAKQLDVQLVKQAILPRVHGLALKTTVAVVRVNALLCLGDLVHTLDKHAALEILQTIQRCTAVDRSAPTLMCTLRVASSMLKQYGVEFVAEHVLPLLIPLLTAQQLNVQQFAKYMLFVKDILRKIEEKKGVAVTDSGIPVVKTDPFANGSQSHPPLNNTSTTVASATKNNPTWDEDWGPTTKGPAPSSQASNHTPSTQHISTTATSSLTSVPSQSSILSTLSGQQTAISCPPVDIEWPPRAAPGVTPQLGDEEKQTNAGTPSFDDVDPFANWPPRPNASSSGSGLSINGSSQNNMSFQVNNNNSWAFNPQNSMEALRPNQGASGLNRGPNSQNSMGFMKQTQGMSTLGTSHNSVRSASLESIFSTSKNDQAAPKLAPPPLTAVGRGRGRGGGPATTSRSAQPKKPSEQPFFDLL
ncbi:hypothetical protein ACFE04_025691 [Oxalis oulophora]